MRTSTILLLIHYIMFMTIGTTTISTTAGEEEANAIVDGKREEEESSLDIDSGPAGGFFDMISSSDPEEDFPLLVLKRTFSISFLNHQLDYSLLEPMDGGCAPETELFVFVPTRPEAFYLRQKIRESWAANLTDLNITLKFVVGWPSDKDNFDMLLEEFLQLNDLILYDIEDSYANLYLKVYIALQWQLVYCPNSQFLLKTDDDTVVDLARLKWWIEREFSGRTKQHPASVFGGLWRGVKAIRQPSHKWFVPRQLYPKSKYPAYMNGPTYLLSNRAVAAILNATEGVKAFSIEDILYTGILANRAHVHKYSVWQHFRQGKYIYVHERCRVDKLEGTLVPFITAIYGIADPDKLQSAFEELRRVDCSPWSSTRRMHWNSFFSPPH